MIFNYVKRIHSSQPSGTGHILQREQPWKNYKVSSANISQEDTTGDKARVECDIQVTDTKTILILVMKHTNPKCLVQADPKNSGT